MLSLSLQSMPVICNVGKKMIRRIVIIPVFIFIVSACFASGWNDYTLDIGDGYNIVQTSISEVCIGNPEQVLILYPNNYDNVGPVIRYIATPKYILTKNLYQKSRVSQDDKTSNECFFIILKGIDKVTGPLSESDFLKLPEVISVGRLDWKTPKNPDFWIPLFWNTIAFVILPIPILAIKFFWITIPVIILIIFFVYQIRRKRKVFNQTL